MGIEVTKRLMPGIYVGAGENWHQLVQFTLDNACRVWKIWH
jgi:UDP-N-acetylenolpyruvoylglucosamine reductase